MLENSDQNDIQELLELRRHKNILAYVSSMSDALAPADCATLIAPAVTSDARGVISAASAAVALENLRQTRPFLFASSRSDSYSTQGIAPPRQLPDVELMTQVMGKGSSSAKAHMLFKTDPVTYHRLKKLAIEMGVLGS
jgi:hypothetical protein